MIIGPASIWKSNEIDTHEIKQNSINVEIWLNAKRFLAQRHAEECLLKMSYRDEYVLSQ